jgi:hypothetical protein
MAGECVRCRSGGVISGGPMAAVSKGVATRIGEEVGEVAGGGWDERLHSTYSFTDL